MKTFFEFFLPYQNVLILFSVVYGVAFGIDNIKKHLTDVFIGKDVIQSDLGRLLDVLWLTSIVIIYANIK